MHPKYLSLNPVASYQTRDFHQPCATPKLRLGVVVHATRLRRYLQAVLSDPTVLESHEMWEFLSRDSMTYCETSEAPSVISALATQTKLGVHTMRADLNLMKRLWEDVDLFSNNSRKPTAEKAGEGGFHNNPLRPSASASALQALQTSPSKASSQRSHNVTTLNSNSRCGVAASGGSPSKVPAALTRGGRRLAALADASTDVLAAMALAESSSSGSTVEQAGAAAAPAPLLPASTVSTTRTVDSVATLQSEAAGGRGGGVDGEGGKSQAEVAGGRDGARVDRDDEGDQRCAAMPSQLPLPDGRNDLTPTEHAASGGGDRDGDDSSDGGVGDSGGDFSSAGGAREESRRAEDVAPPEPSTPHLQPTAATAASAPTPIHTPLMEGYEFQVGVLACCTSTVTLASSLFALATRGFGVITRSRVKHLRF